MERAVTVRGHGRASRRPDQAILSVSVERTSATAAAAQEDTSKRARGVMSALSERNVTAVDVASSAITLEPVYDYPDSGPRLTGYRSSHSLTIRLQQIDELGPIIDACVAAGATGIANVSMTIADPAAAEDEARTAAVADAWRRAETLAAAAGVTLGELISLTEVIADHGPRPMMRMRAEAMMAADTPVAEGTTELEAEVEARFAISA